MQNDWRREADKTFVRACMFHFWNCRICRASMRRAALFAAGNERLPSNTMNEFSVVAGTQLATHQDVAVYRVGGVMKKMVREFIADESGATAIEYGLIAAGIALAIISAVQGVGTKLSANFGKISTSLK